MSWWWLGEFKMRVAFVIVANAIIAADPAMASDMTPIPATAPAPVYSRAETTARAYSTTVNTITGAVDNSGRISRSNFRGGGQFGFNYSMPWRLVIGVQADVSTGDDHTTTFSNVAGTNQHSEESKTVAIGALRARVGYAIANVLIYGIGGWAWTDATTTRTQLAGKTGKANPGTVESVTENLNGWTAGAGLAYGFWHNWEVFAEYRYTSYLSSNVGFLLAQRSTASTTTTNSIAGGLSFKFDPSSPVIDCPALRAPLRRSRDHDGDRAPDRDRLAGGRELARAGIDAKRNHRVGLLVGGMEKASGRVEADEARAAALRGLPADRGQRSVAGSGVDRHAVVTAIGAIRMAAVRRDGDLGGRAAAGEAGRKGGRDLQGRQRSMLGVPTIGRDRAVELIEDPHDRQRWMECEMPGTGAGTRPDGSRRGEPAVHLIEAKDEDAIESLVGNQHEAAGGVEHHVMGMRTRLLGRVRTGLARQYHQLMLIRKRSARLDGEYRDAAAPVIRRAIEREGGGIVAVAVDRIEETLAGAEHKVGRIVQVTDVLDMRPSAGRRMDPVNMNAIAARLAPGAGE
jgi:outer membrane immunogenic protein